jgi:hypothetical protein
MVNQINYQRHKRWKISGEVSKDGLKQKGNKIKRWKPELIWKKAE